MARTIDLTPTWGEVGLMVKRLAMSNEEKALRTIWPEAARAFASAQALTALQPSLTSEQKTLVDRVMDEELKKQGHDPNNRTKS